MIRSSKNVIDNSKSDTVRVAIAVFIVATTLTVLNSKFAIPSILFIPMAAFVIGLVITAILAFLFILAKGYELRYNKKADNLVDKYNYILYNAAMSAYVIVTFVILATFIFGSLNDLSKAGNSWATVGIIVLFMATIGIFNRRDIRDLYQVIAMRLKKSK